jgi:hypothetical protein
MKHPTFNATMKSLWFWWFMACLFLGWKITHGQVVIMTASVPERHQAWAQENCIEGNLLCYKLTPSDAHTGKMDSEALDLTSGQFMVTIWLNSDYMARNITEADGTFTCDLMSRGESDILYTPCDLLIISKLIR